MSDQRQAFQFLELFPEAVAWKICILTKEKKECILSAPSMSSTEVHKRISGWLKQTNVHVFVRPLMANLVFLDLDKFPVDNDNFGVLVRLKPRAIVKNKHRQLSSLADLANSQ